MLATGFRIGGSVHIREQRNFLYPQGIDNDVNVDIAALVMTVGVGADDGLVSAKMRFAKFLAQLLCAVNGQSVVYAVPWVKRNNVVVAFHIFAFLVFAVAEIRPHTGNSEIFLTTANRGDSEILARYEPPVFIKRGLHRKFIVGKGQIFFGCAVISIFRADMFERSHSVHLPFARPHI